MYEASKRFSVLYSQGVWRGGETLQPEDSVASILKQGTLSIGFIGLAECLVALTGKHHGEDEESWKLGYEITFMRDRMDKATEETSTEFLSNCNSSRRIIREVCEKREKNLA